MTQETFGKGKIREEIREFITTVSFTQENYFLLKKIVKSLAYKYEGLARKRFTAADLFEIFISNYDQFAPSIEKIIKRLKK